MFQSEQLQEKWAPLLNHEGCEQIKDSHRRAVTAVLLENQEKFLREQNAFSDPQVHSCLKPQQTAAGSGANPGLGGATTGRNARFRSSPDLPDQTLYA